MGEKQSARQRLLDAAAELFYADGVAATGIDAITAKAGVAKMSLYNNFASKADLVQAYLDRRCEEWRSVRADRLARAVTPQDKVLAVFDSYLDHAHLAYQWGFRGCGLLNAAAEFPIDDPARQTVAAQKDEVEALFRLYLTEIRPEDPEAVSALAEHLSYLLEGAMAPKHLGPHLATEDDVPRPELSLGGARPGPWRRLIERMKGTSA